jgi:hypothetical protein
MVLSCAPPFAAQMAGPELKEYLQSVKYNIDTVMNLWFECLSSIALSHGPQQSMFERRAYLLLEMIKV